MESAPWIVNHWLDLLQSIGIISGLVFTAHSIRKDADARKISNLIALSERHHAIWKQFYSNPKLSRILDEAAVLEAKPVTHDEQRFVTSLTIHLDCVHRAMKAKMFVKLEGLQKDVKGLFSLPVPKAVWERLKPFHDEDFVSFVENCLRSPADR